MGDAFVADLASGLVRKLVSLATEEVIQAWNLHDDLITLRERLESIDALLSDAYTNKIAISSVQNWFNKLQAVAQVADVVMDELAYEATRRKVESSRKVREFFIPSKNTILYRFKLAHKIKSINTSFGNIFKWAGDLGLQPVAHLSSSLQPREIRNTPPFEDESQIVGRDEDISYLVQTTCQNHNEDLKVIAIIGMGGQGKTTLARMVYNNEAVINMFPKRMWVTVSDDFNFMKILNQMVVSLTSITSVLENTEGLIKDLQKNLKGEKFLLVLDDVWNEKLEEWDNLRNSLLGVGGAIGSNILLTTRKQEVVDAMQCSVSHAVEKLSDEYSWELFKRRAFSHGGVSYNGTFDALGRRMVKRCGGLPLAIKTLGGLLHTKKSEEEWLVIQDSEIWKSKGVLSSLRLSYDNLPYSSLKRCFTYFSILPKDSLIYKKELVQIWMALGFLLTPIDSNVLMEDIGNEYFNVLLWNSLLQEVERDELGNITSCKMHSLVHDLALDLSKHHSITVKAGHELNHIYSTAMYLRLDKGVSDIKPTTVKRNFERVQILYAGDRILNDVLPHLKCLNVLVLNTHEISKGLPRSLSMMKYLKHLDISCFHYRLPSYITELYNLQTLRVWSLRELPKKFCNLINLRHLHIVNANERCMFVGIERLTCLQTLPHFVVNRDKKCVVGQLEGLKNLRGELELYGLNDIDNMEEASSASLCTKPNIQRLLLDWSNSKDEREDIACNNEYVMEGLKPHANLKELMIDCYNGYNFASWIIMMTNLVKITLKDCNRCEVLPPLGHLPKLREMEISGMNFLKVIGSDFYGGLDSSSSEVSYARVSKTVTTMHPALRRLILWNLPKLKEWIEPLMSTGGKDQDTVLIFPKLEVLSIKFCSKLTRIPSSCFPSLKQLIIQDLDSSVMLETMTRNVSSLSYIRLSSISIREESLPFFATMDSIINELMKNNSLSLRTLNLEECQGLTCLKLGAAVVELRVINCPNLTSSDVVKESIAQKCLTQLQIRSCPSLSSWVFAKSLCSTLVRLLLGPFVEELDEFPWPVSSPVTSFPNLNSLLLWGWIKLKTMLPIGEHDDSLSSTFPALTELTIYNYEGMEGLPDSLAKLPSLTSLFIWNCKNLKSLPTFDKSDSLLLLKISGCLILEERCMKESRPEWFKIQHIPHVKWD